MLKKFVFATLAMWIGVVAYSQGKMSIANVHAALLRNSGTIIENSETKGYFFFYQSDRINKQTNEYTLQILDQNVNKVIDIKFEDTKRLSLLEAAYNSSSLAFLFKNDDNKTLDLKVYDISGRLKYCYSRNFDKKSEGAMKRYQPARADAGTNNIIFDVGEKGYASVYPVYNGEQMSYEVDFYSSETRMMWTYVPVIDSNKEKYVSAAYLGNTDSLIIFRVLNKRTNNDRTVHPAIVAINFHTGKKAFAMHGESEGIVIMPSAMMHIKDTDRILVMGNYHGDKAALNSSGKGIAAYELDTRGNVLLKKYNSWSTDMSPVYIHKLVQSNEKVFAVGERKERKRKCISSSLPDLIMIEFNNEYQVSNVTAQHTTRFFDYEFTARNDDNSNFSVCYSDYVNNGNYKGQVFNSIRYNGERFVNDKITLKTKANKIQVLPAKMGSVMIVEYFRRSRKLEIRIEKMG